MNRFDRILGIVLRLRSNERLSASQLAAQFAVSRRTIYRDIETLSLLGVPVYSERGRDGGIRLLEGYFLPTLMFSTKEAISLLLGLAFLAYGASALFKELKIALHAVWGLPPAPKKGLKANIISQVTAVVMVLMIGFFFLLLIVINLAISLLDSYIFYGELGLLQWGSLLGSILVVALLIGFMYRVIPDITLPWSDLWVGALVTTLLMMIGVWGIKLYLTISNVGSAAGTASALIIMLLGIYYAAQVFLLGASFVAAYAKNFGSEKASQVLTMYDSPAPETDSQEDSESVSRTTA